MSSPGQEEVPFRGLPFDFRGFFPSPIAFQEALKLELMRSFTSQEAAGRDKNMKAEAYHVLAGGLPFDVRSHYETHDDFRNALIWEMQRSVKDLCDATRAANAQDGSTTSRKDSVAEQEGKAAE